MFHTLEDVGGGLIITLQSMENLQRPETRTEFLQNIIEALETGLLNQGSQCELLRYTPPNSVRVGAL